MRPKREIGRCKQCMSWHEIHNDFCPLVTKAYSMYKAEKKFSDHYFGEAPAPFIGRYGYPKVNVGILGLPHAEEEAWKYDAPRYWSSQNFGVEKIVDYRTAMVNSREKVGVRETSKIVELSQEVALASKPVNVEVKLKKAPRFSFSVSPFTMPIGPGANIEKAEVTSNVKIARKVDKAVSDTDLKAADALVYLYNKKIDENKLSRILSVGTLGIGKNRKLVPTRWSITATDDIVGKSLISEIKDLKEIEKFTMFYGAYMGNHYFACLFPEKWSYDLFEIASPSGNYGNDYESYKGRKNYAEETAGGYYAARLAVLEKLRKIKRQASVLLLRFITEKYPLPLGVWVVREAARNAMKGKKIEFESKELMLKYAILNAKKKFGINLNKILKKSRLMKSFHKSSHQKKLLEY